MPAAAVIPAPQVVVDIIEPKTVRSRSFKSLGKSGSLTVRTPGRLKDLGPGEVRGTSGVGVKSCNPGRTTGGEGV